MKNGAAIFLAVFIALGLSWCGFVLAPARQLGGAKQTTVLNSSDLYPVGRPGEANLGLQVYRANGCAACHTEQVRQTGVACNVVLTGAGKNPEAVSNLVSALKLNGLAKEDADAVSDQISAAGGKAEIHIVATGHGHCAGGVGDAPKRCGRLSLRLSGSNWKSARRTGPVEHRRARSGHELAIGASLRATCGSERFHDATVPLSF